MLVRYRGRRVGDVLHLPGLSVSHGQHFEWPDGEPLPHGCVPVDPPKPKAKRRRKKATPQVEPAPAPVPVEALTLEGD